MKRESGFSLAMDSQPFQNNDILVTTTEATTSSLAFKDLFDYDEQVDHEPSIH